MLITNEQKISKKTIFAIIATGLMSFSGVVIETATSVTFPTLMHQFSLSTNLVQWMTTIYLLTIAAVIPMSGILKRNFYTKKLFLVANLTFMLGLLIDIFAPNFILLLLGRCAQGLGTGIALPLMFNIILSEVPKSKIGVMMGFGALMTAVAPAVGPTFGGILNNTLGWRYIFIILLPFIIFSLIIGSRFISKTNHLNPTTFDLKSEVLITIAFIALVLGVNNLAHFSIAIISLIVCFTSIIFLFQTNKHIKKPLINLNILKKAAFAWRVVAFFILQFLTLGFYFVLPNYMQLVNGKSSFVAGLLCIPGAAIGAVFAPVGGKLLDTYGARKPIVFGGTVDLITLITFVIIGEHLTPLMIMGLYFTYMLGMGMAFGNLMTDSLNQLSKTQKLDGNAVLNTLNQFAGAISTAIVAAIINEVQQNHPGSTASLTAIGSEHALIFMLILDLIEFLIVFRVIKKQVNH